MKPELYSLQLPTSYFTLTVIEITDEANRVPLLNLCARDLQEENWFWKDGMCALHTIHHDYQPENVGDTFAS